MNVSYLGPESSFTYQAACQLFPTEQLTAYASIPVCLRALFRKQVDLAVVPVENSLKELFITQSIFFPNIQKSKLKVKSFFLSSSSF